MNAVDALALLFEEIRLEFPNFRIVHKREDKLSGAINLALRVMTFGGQRHYMTRYHTVIGDTLYVPSCWDEESCIDKIILLRHERVHLRQRRRHGMAMMSLRYLLWPFPVGLAYGRARLEWEAYEETLRATLEWCGEQAVRDPAMKLHMVERFTGPDYLWMWPFPRQIERWYDEALERLLSQNEP